ncbi:MAG: hypothetical protein WA138_07880 [Parvibaculum sp.]
MTDALSIAIGGLHTASLKASEAANQVSHINVPVPPPTPSDPPTNENPAVINDTGKAKQEPDALKAITDFQKAARAYEAHVKLVQALSDAQNQIVEALGWAPSADKSGPASTAKA